MTLFDPDPPVEPLLPFQRHSPTSESAAKMMRRHAAAQREAVYKAIAADPDGLTDQQISERTGLDGNSVRPRRVELVRAQRIEQCGHRRTASGREAVVWKAKGGVVSFRDDVGETEVMGRREG